MHTKETLAGRLVLVACNVAGMVDLVALPLWVGVLMQSRSLGPQAAGLTVTCYVLGVFASSIALSRRFDSIPGRPAAAAGFALGAAAFLGLMMVDGVGATAALHVLAGLGAGCGLSFTHGTIARVANPHRMFAMAGIGVGVFAIPFFALTPGIIIERGANGLFAVLGTLLAVAAVAALVAFPSAVSAGVALQDLAAPSGRARLAFAGVACFATRQSMVFSFVERIGIDHGFTLRQVGAMLLVGGFVNLTAPLLASLVQRCVSAFAVSTFAIPLHGVVGALVTVTASYVPWAAAAILFVWLILFGHNFMFGLIARLDPSGRTAATTPAMLMVVGAAIGPALGGVLAQQFGFASLGVAALVIATVGTLCFATVWRHSRAMSFAAAA